MRPWAGESLTGSPGLMVDAFLGETAGTLTISTAATHTAGASTVDHTSETLITDGVYPLDIYEDVDQNRKFLIRDMVDEDTIDLGAPVPVQLSASNNTVVRRAIPLPTAGSRNGG